MHGGVGVKVYSKFDKRSCKAPVTLFNQYIKTVTLILKRMNNS